MLKAILSMLFPGDPTQQQGCCEPNLHVFLGIKRAGCFLSGSPCQILVLSRSATNSDGKNKMFCAKNLSDMFIIGS